MQTQPQVDAGGPAVAITTPFYAGRLGDGYVEGKWAKEGRSWAQKIQRLTIIMKTLDTHKFAVKKQFLNQRLF